MRNLQPQYRDSCARSIKCVIATMRSLLTLILAACVPLAAQLRGALNDDYLETLAGRWRTEALHLHADGARVVEHGEVDCRWILRRTYLRCERRHRSRTGERLSQQLYVRDSSGGIEMLTLAAGRATRVLLVAESGVPPIVFVGALPSGTRPMRMRGTATVEGVNRIVYRNETEERANQWRADYIEKYFRR